MDTHKPVLLTSWRVALEARRLLSMPVLRCYVKLCGVQWGEGWRLYGAPIIQRHPGSTISIGDRACLRSSHESNPLAPMAPVVLSTRRPDSRIEIGSDFGMTGGSIVAQESIVVGNRVMVGANCVICDTDFHPLDAVERSTSPHDGASSPIEIGDDVFLGTRVLVLKGVRLGAGCVVGAGSVVASNIPPRCVAAGVPARVLRKI